MIRFALKCDHDHSFESWFQSGSAFDKVKLAGMVACPICGSTNIEKTLMAPRVQTARNSTLDSKPQDRENKTEVAPEAPTTLHDQTAQNEIAEKITALKAHVEATSEYVGDSFAKEARAMHEGDTPERPIYGEAKVEEAVALAEEGVPLTPLPFIPARKTN